MNKKVVLGIIAGVAGVSAGVAVGVAVKKIVDKISAEMESTQSEVTFVSPEGNNIISLLYGSSETAKGLARICVTATTEDKEDECKLFAFAKMSSTLFDSEWIDNNHFKLLIGSSSRKQCCDVTFDNGKITATYYLCKVEK